jgi:hypothetical protein
MKALLPRPRRAEILPFIKKNVHTSTVFMSVFIYRVSILLHIYLNAFVHNICINALFEVLLIGKLDFIINEL